MPRKSARELREPPPARRRHGQAAVPPANLAARRIPAWMKGGGVHIAAAPPRGAHRCKQTGKIRYATEERAARALVRAQNDARRPEGEAREVRHYPCPFCDGHHLTSKALNERGTA